MKTISIILFSAFALLIIMHCSCTQNNQQDLLGEILCDTSSVSFSSDLMPVIAANCNTSGCHNSNSQAGGYNLEGYSNVKSAIDGGRLIGSVNHEVGFSPMPKSQGKLDECFLLQLSVWVDRGSNNN